MASNEQTQPTQFYRASMPSPFESPAKRRLIMASNEQTQPKFQAINDSFIPTNQEQQEEDQAFGDINSNFIHFNGSQTQVIPPGYRFCPYDGELIVYYLKKKVDNEALPHNGIIDVNIYLHNPDYLTDRYPALGDKHWYFFTPRERKHRNGTRPNRTAGDGYWKATGADKPVRQKGQFVGYKRALVFYLGKPRKSNKTNWIMHEFTVDHKPSRTTSKDGQNDMRLDWVLCMIYKKEPGKGKEGEELDKHKSTADPATLLASSVDENDLMVESSEHNNVHVQSTKLSQASRSTNGCFLPDHTSIAASDQPILNGETRPAEVRYPPFQHLDNKYFQEDDQDDFLADLDTTLWELEDNCGLCPDNVFDDLDTILGGLEEDHGFINLDGLFANPPNLAGQNFNILV